jgi:hypothetical protein
MYYIRLNDYNALFHFEIESYTDFGPLVSKDHQLYHKPMSIVCSLNELDGKPLISGSAGTYLLKTYDLILNFLISQHKLNINHDVFSINT